VPVLTNKFCNCQKLLPSSVLVFSEGLEAFYLEITRRHGPEQRHQKQESILEIPVRWYARFSKIEHKGLDAVLVPDLSQGSDGSVCSQAVLAECPKLAVKTMCWHELMYLRTAVSAYTYCRSSRRYLVWSWAACQRCANPARGMSLTSKAFQSENLLVGWGQPWKFGF